MFGVVRMGDQRQMILAFNQNVGMQYLLPRQVFYQVPRSNGWEMNSGSSFVDADHMQNRTAVDWSVAIDSCQREVQQEEEWRKWLKEACDAGAKKTEQTNLFVSMLLEVLGFRMADNPFEAGHKAVSVLNKYRRICGN